MLSQLFSLALLATSTLSLPITLLDITLPFANAISSISESSNTTQTVNSILYSFNSTIPLSRPCTGSLLPTDNVAALPLSFFNSSNDITTYCGAYIILNSNITQKTLTVRIVDVALTPAIALSASVFVGLNSTVESLGLVNWRFASLNETEEALEGSIRTGALAAMLGVASILSDMKPTAVVATPSSTPSTINTSVYTPEYNSSPTTIYTPEYTPAATVQAVASVAPSDNQSSSSSSSSSYSSSSSSSGTYSGQATYYTQNGVAGACGKVNPDSAYIVAIDIDMYNGGNNCGKSVKIVNTATGASVTATVADMCPTCASSGSLDLSVAAFNAIGNESQGVIPMTWSFL